MVTKEIEKCSNCATNKTFTYCLHCKYLHSAHIIFHHYLHRLHHSTHHNILYSLAWHCPPYGKDSSFSSLRSSSDGRLVGLPLWKLYDMLKNTKDLIFEVLYTGYMYTYTQRKIYHVYILEYILGDIKKQHHQGLKVSLLHILHDARYTLATRSSTAQVCYIKI